MAKKGVTLVQTDFPLYTVRCLGDRHFIVAGGGGQAKTGISNAIDIYELRHQDGSCVARQVNHYDTGSAAIMNCSVMQEDPRSFCVATSQDDLCQLYNLRFKVVAHKEGQEDDTSPEGLRKRRTNQTKCGDYKAAPKTVIFDIEKGPSAKTDFHKDEAFQKLSVFSNNKELLVTAGADGHVRAWKPNTLEKLYDINAHTNEIDDLAINPPCNRIVSVSKDNRALLWNAKDGSKKLEIKWTKQTDVPYRFRNCRYGIVIDRKDQHHLFTSHIPSKRGMGSKKKPHCYLTKWNARDYTPEKIQDAGEETLSAMAISTDGIYLGVGTIEGSVSVYISFSLQRLYHLRQAHNIFVTGVEFAPQERATRVITGDHDFSLLSISADNSVMLHQQPQRSAYSIVWILMGFVFFLYLFWIFAAWIADSGF